MNAAADLQSPTAVTAAMPSSAHVQRDIDALSARLAANERETTKVEAALGADYQALLSGDQVATGAQQRLEVLRLDKRALAVGIESAKRSLAAAIERERIAAALTVRSTLKGRLLERNAAAAAADQAIEALAVALLDLADSQHDAAGALYDVRLPEATLTPSGWLVNEEPAPLQAPEVIKNLVEARLNAFLGAIWPARNGLTAKAARTTFADTVQASTRGLMVRFDAHERLPAAVIPADEFVSFEEVPVEEWTADELAEFESMRLAKAAMHREKEARKAGAGSLVDYGGADDDSDD